MTLIIIIITAALAIVAAAATIHSLVTDGYHQVPTRTEGAHHYR